LIEVWSEVAAGHKKWGQCPRGALFGVGTFGEKKE